MSTLAILVMINSYNLTTLNVFHSVEECNAARSELVGIAASNGAGIHHLGNGSQIRDPKEGVLQLYCVTPNNIWGETQ